MPDTPAAETQLEQMTRWIDIDKPAPDIAAETAARAQADRDAQAALSAGKTDAERLGDLQDKVNQLRPSSEAGSQVEFAGGVLGNMLIDVQAGRMPPEQAREALEGIIEAAEGLDTGAFTADMQARVDEARAQLVELHDLKPDTPMAEAGEKVVEFLGAGTEMLTPLVELREDAQNATGDMAEAVLEARADIPGADIDAIEAQLDTLDRLRDQDAAEIEARRDEHDLLNDKLDVTADLYRDGAIHKGMSQDEIDAVAAPAFQALDADYAADHPDAH